MATAAAGTYTTLNMDIVGLWNRINRFIEECGRSVSSNLSLTNTFDTERLTTYLNAIDKYHAHVAAQPFLDLPETSPRLYVLLPPPAIFTVESDDMDDILNMFRLMRDELVGSQSSRMPVGIIAPDSRRLTAIVQKARNFLSDYVGPTQPLDLPESSPNTPLSPAGLGGI